MLKGGRGRGGRGGTGDMDIQSTSSRRSVLEAEMSGIGWRASQMKSSSQDELTDSA